MPPFTFLPTTRKELEQKGRAQADVILVTGDAYVDHPSFPAALLGRYLESQGFTVGILARPDVSSPESFKVLGLPRLCFGVTAGALDSMVANYTALGKKRNDDPYAPDGISAGRPDRAVTVYCNMIRQAYGKDAFIVTGGIEASLRRFAHYDFMTKKIRRPILLDCGADVLVFGMGEVPLLEIVRRLDALEKKTPNADNAEKVEALRSIAGLQYKEPRSNPKRDDAIELAAMEAIQERKAAYMEAFNMIEKNPSACLSQSAAGLRVVQNPPAKPLTTDQLDALYALRFTRRPHPAYGKQAIPALEQVRFSVTSHRGCFGGCGFCAITQHQGKRIQSRSARSICAEIEAMVSHPDFKGVINDVGGPTANMYGLACMKSPEGCNRPSCLWPAVCKHLKTDDTAYRNLLKRARRIKGVRHLFITSGLRYDLLLLQPELLQQIAKHHTSGRFKVAPEHASEAVLKAMRKPSIDRFREFLAQFQRASAESGKRQRVVPYIIAAHPVATENDMRETARFLQRHRLYVDACQIFTPTPMTASTAMYYTGLDAQSGKPIFVERERQGKQRQKDIVLKAKKRK